MEWNQSLLYSGRIIFSPPLFHLTQFCAKTKRLCFSPSYLHTDPPSANTGSSTLSRKNSQHFFKSHIKIHPCQVLLSFHMNIFFPRYSGSGEWCVSHTFDLTNGRSPPPGPVLLWGWETGRKENIGFQRLRLTRFHYYEWRPCPHTPTSSLLPSPKVLGSREGNWVGAVASGFSRCLGLTFTLTKMLMRN